MSRPVKTKKAADAPQIFCVTITRELYVLALDEHDAEIAAEQFERDEDQAPSTEARPVGADEELEPGHARSLPWVSDAVGELLGDTDDRVLDELPVQEWVSGAAQKRLGFKQ